MVKLMSRWAPLLLVLCLIAVQARADEKQKTIAEQMAANPRLSKWVAILKELDLWESFQTSPPVTAFAPTNEAVDEIPALRWKALKKDNEAYRRVVLYHFVRGSKANKDFL